MAATSITVVHVNTDEMSYFDFILNVARESCYLPETFYLIFQTKDILFILLNIQCSVLIAKQTRNTSVF